MPHFGGEMLRNHATNCAHISQEMNAKIPSVTLIVSESEIRSIALFVSGSERLTVSGSETLETLIVSGFETAYQRRAHARSVDV